MKRFIIFILMLLCLTKLEAQVAQQKKFSYYTIAYPSLEQYFKESIDKNNISEDLKVTYIECTISKKSFGVELLINYQYFPRIIEKKAYGVTIINGIPIFLYGKKTKNIFKKEHKKVNFPVHSPEEYHHVLIEYRTEKVWINL